MPIPAVSIPAVVLAAEFPTGADRTAGTFNAKAVAWANSENAMVTRAREIADAARLNALVANQAANEANNHAGDATTQAAIAAQQLPLAAAQVALAANQVTLAGINAANASISAGQAALTVAAAGYAGVWSSLTGALAAPATASHAGRLWRLTVSLANVTTAVPGVDSRWFALGGIDAAETAYTNFFLS